MKAELIDFMGSDLSIVNSARVSFANESDWEEITEQMGDGYSRPTGDLRLFNRDTKLVQYLAKHDHFTPFTHTAITLRETVPIFVARQRFKHVVGFTYNEVSRRYVDDPPEFYVPEVWRGKPVNAKQGSSDTPVDDQLYWRHEYANAYDQCLHVYNEMIKGGVAPEQARMVLPQSMYTSYYTTGSLAAYARAYNLRSDPHAQLEIQELAKMWDEIIRPLFPVGWSSLVDAT